MNLLSTTPVNLREEYAKTEISKILNILDEELVHFFRFKKIAIRQHQVHCHRHLHQPIDCPTASQHGG